MIRSQIMLNDGETVVINGMPIDNKLINALNNLYILDRPAASIGAITADILHCKELASLGAADTPLLSEDTMILNQSLVGLLIEQDRLESSRLRLEFAELAG